MYNPYFSIFRCGKRLSGDRRGVCKRLLLLARARNRGVAEVDGRQRRTGPGLLEALPEARYSANYSVSGAHEHVVGFRMADGDGGGILDTRRVECTSVVLEDRGRAVQVVPGVAGEHDRATTETGRYRTSADELDGAVLCRCLPAAVADLQRAARERVDAEELGSDRCKVRRRPPGGCLLRRRDRCRGGVRTPATSAATGEKDCETENDHRNDATKNSHVRLLQFGGQVEKSSGFQFTSFFNFCQV